MRKDISRKFIKKIDKNAKLYQVVNADGVKMYAIEVKRGDEYVKAFSCVAIDGEPELMIEHYLEIASTGRFVGLWEA